MRKLRTREDPKGCINISKWLSRNEYQTLLEHAPIMIWRSNTTGGCDYFNDGWLRFRGRQMEQECGNQWAEGVHPEDLQRCLNIYSEAFKNREPFEMEYRLQRYDGVYRWILDRGTPVFLKNRKFQGYIGSCIDITERIEVEETRDRELTNLRGILPICMQCKKIRQRDGDWMKLESYIQSHSRAEFSHGLCPACYRTFAAQFLHKTGSVAV